MDGRTTHYLQTQSKDKYLKCNTVMVEVVDIGCILKISEYQFVLVSKATCHSIVDSRWINLSFKFQLVITLMENGFEILEQL